MIYLDLLLGFLRVGLFSFGGAYGAIPIIRDIVLSYGWLTDEELTYMIAVSESTPGPIMVNLATYIGSTQAGFFGAVLATIAVVLPAFIVMLLVMIFFKTLLENKHVQAILQGLKPCIIGIIFATGIYMTGNNCISLRKNTSVNVQAVIITAILSVMMFGTRAIWKKKISPVMLIVISACLGIILEG